MSEKRHILITGSTGFIGRHVVASLLEKNFMVMAIVRKTGNSSELKKAGITLLHADLTEISSVERIFGQLAATKTKIDYVIHAAALTKARTEKEMTEANCEGTRNLLTAMETYGLLPEKFIFISSLAAPGPQSPGGIIKKDQQQPVTRYGKSKLQAEAIVKSFSGIPHIILRPTAVYGPGEKDLLTVFKIVNRGFNPVTGFSEQELTFVHVKDLVRLIMAAIESQEKNKTYFVTDGHVYAKTALAKAISESLNKNSRTIRLPLFLVKSLAFLSEYGASLLNRQSSLNLQKYKELTAASWNCEVEETFRELNYTPEYNLQSGVRDTTRWYKENKWI